MKTKTVLAIGTVLVMLGAVTAGCTGHSAVTPTSVAVVTSVAAVTTTQTAGQSEGTSGNTPAFGTTTTYQSIDSGGTEYTATDTSYTSDTTSVVITEVSSGSGGNALTYYVADVQLTAGTLLQAGLADGFERGKIDYTSSIAEENGAIVAINGDFCTARDTGVIIRNGVLYLDSPARQGLAIYQDGTMQVYDETEVSAEELLAAGVWNTYSFGPALLIDGVIPAGLDQSEVEDIGEKHTILGSQPRTGIGIIDTNHFVFVVVDGRSEGYSTGATLSELAQIFEDLGCTAAYNLDGGGSSTMYFMGGLVNNPLGEGKERGISDILMVK